MSARRHQQVTGQVANQKTDRPRGTDKRHQNDDLGESPAKFLAWLWGVPLVVIAAAVVFRSLQG